MKKYLLSLIILFFVVFGYSQTATEKYIMRNIQIELPARHNYKYAVRFDTVKQLVYVYTTTKDKPLIESAVKKGVATFNYFTEAKARVVFIVY